MTEMRHYGDWIVVGELADRGTVHGSGTIDIQIDPETREVVAAWFRCRTLPFTVSPGCPPAHQPPIAITADEYLENETGDLCLIT